MGTVSSARFKYPFPRRFPGPLTRLKPIAAPLNIKEPGKEEQPVRKRRRETVRQPARGSTDRGLAATMVRTRPLHELISVQIRRVRSPIVDSPFSLGLSIAYLLRRAAGTLKAGRRRESRATEIRDEPVTWTLTLGMRCFEFLLLDNAIILWDIVQILSRCWGLIGNWQESH